MVQTPTTTEALREALTTGDHRDRYSLCQIMEFDHVIEVTTDGRVIDRPDLHGPDLCDDELETAAPWSLLTGYTGQYGYSGPIMHNSEYIGGGMALDILDSPGVYVALVSYYSTDADDQPHAEDDGPYAEGWAVAYRQV